jgi:hypothetical protein
LERKARRGPKIRPSRKRCASHSFLVLAWASATAVQRSGTKRAVLGRNAQECECRKTRTASDVSTSGTHYCPGVTGGTEWNGAAWDPRTRLVYVNSVDWCVTVKLSKLASIKNVATGAAKA